MSGPMGRYTTAAVSKFSKALVLDDNLGMKMNTVQLVGDKWVENLDVELKSDLVGKGVWGILSRKLADSPKDATVETYFIGSEEKKGQAFFKSELNENHAEMVMLKRVDALLAPKDKAKAKFVFVQGRGPCTRCLECIKERVVEFQKFYPNHFDSLSVVYNEHYLTLKGKEKLAYTWETAQEAKAAYSKVCLSIANGGPAKSSPLRIRSIAEVRAARDTHEKEAQTKIWQASLKGQWAAKK